MANHKKTRTFWQSIIYYTVIALTLLGVSIIWSFAGIFNFPFWKFLMGMIAGFLVTYIYLKQE
jgi:hypothetical protein